MDIELKFTIDQHNEAATKVLDRWKKTIWNMTSSKDVSQYRALYVELVRIRNEQNQNSPKLFVVSPEKNVDGLKVSITVNGQLTDRYTIPPQN